MISTTHDAENSEHSSVAQPHDDFLNLYDQMIGGEDLPDVLYRITGVLKKHLAAERVTVFSVCDETQTLESVSMIGNVPNVIRVPINPTSLAGYCASSGVKFVVPDAYGDLSSIDPGLRFDSSWDEQTGFRTRDVICVPISFRDKTLGVIQLINRMDRPFCPDDLSAVERAAGVAAYVLYHACLHDELRTYKKLDKEKAEFMRIMVHELKSPVSTSKMMADALVFTAADDDRSSPTLTKISQRMEGLLTLIQDILELSRVKEGAPMGEVTVLDVADQASRVCETYRDQAQAKGLDFSLAVPEEKIPVRCDEKGLQMVISNLVSNAVKYTPEGGVSIVIRRDDKSAEIAISDTGLGIPEKDVPRLFGEFFRASNVKGTKINGSGVGLAGAKQIVERFDGTMSLRTEQDRGSTFVVRLPVWG